MTKSGFIHNIQKYIWVPCKILAWLGIDTILSSETLKITKSRIDNILNTISLILRKIFVSRRILFPAKSKAILICPHWPSPPFWPWLTSGHDTYFSFVKNISLIKNLAACIKLGDNKKSILGSRVYQGCFIAILMIKWWLFIQKKKRKENYLVIIDAIR